MKKVFRGFAVAITGMALALLDANFLFLGELFNFIISCDQSATSSVSCTESYDAVLVFIITLIAAGGFIYALMNLVQLARTKRER